ncbi:Uncharacterised protein [Chlamydia trachomatis]|nr:Uncharacterised protein [Chlamydia trachomatis]
MNMAAGYPSITLWSTDNVNIQVKPTASSPFKTTGCSSTLPTARIAACGGFKIAVKSEIPVIPRLDTQKEPPLYSSSARDCCLALVASPLISAEIIPIFFLSAQRTIGAITPSGIATAIEISIVENRIILLSTLLNPELISGNSFRAKAQARTIQSLIESLIFCS